MVNGKTLRKIMPTLPLTFQFNRPQTRGLKRHGPSTLAPPTPQRSVAMDHGQEEVQHGFTLGRTWGMLP
ncbi:hypothetical protein O181_010051 [Austropuccinia psidii MF-1]|uniref:Uncharacterized protein n=1 Tax=Austropuccinia psidii MF-1 TaxID=1389203 RepID=A0A9Q3GK17_9BASI|nr:hypothetical protein [Austropuccinia psidii MF-1]